MRLLSALFSRHTGCPAASCPDALEAQWKVLASAKRQYPKESKRCDDAVGGVERVRWLPMHPLRKFKHIATGCSNLLSYVNLPCLDEARSLCHKSGTQPQAGLSGDFLLCWEHAHYEASRSSLDGPPFAFSVAHLFGAHLRNS